jgi:hypothetical protein
MKRTVHCFLKKTGASSPWLEMATHTIILGAWCTLAWITSGSSDVQNRTFSLLTTPTKWKCASSENQTLLNDISLFWAHPANVILWCLFWAVSLGNPAILYGYKSKSLFNIRCTDRVDILSCAAAFLVDLHMYHLIIIINCSSIIQRSILNFYKIIQQPLPGNGSANRHERNN